MRPVSEPPTNTKPLVIATSGFFVRIELARRIRAAYVLSVGRRANGYLPQ